MSRVSRAAALAVVLLVAGCIGGPATGPTADSPTASPPGTSAGPVDSTDETPSSTTTQGTSMGDDGYYRAYTVQASPVTIHDVAAEIARSPAELERDDEEKARIVRRAATTGCATRVLMNADVRRPLDGEPVVVSGTYYRVNATVTARAMVTAHYVTADGPLENRYEGAELDPYRERAVNYGALPPGDRGAVNATIHVSDRPFENLHGIGYWYHFRNGSVPANSVLADGEEHVVRYNDTLWKVRLERDHTSQQVRYRVRYTLDTVAENESAWHDYVRAHDVTAYGNVSVSPAGRDVLRRAIENGSVEWEGTTEDDPAGFEDLANALRHGYVERNGTLYRVTVQKVME